MCTVSMVGQPLTKRSFGLLGFVDDMGFIEDTEPFTHRYKYIHIFNASTTSLVRPNPQSLRPC